MKSNKGNSGPLIASIIVVLVLAISGYYAIKDRPLKNEVELPTIEEEIANIESQSTSTEITDIEADLEGFDFEGLGTDLEAADSEL